MKHLFLLLLSIICLQGFAQTIRIKSNQTFEEEGTCIDIKANKHKILFSDPAFDKVSPSDFLVINWTEDSKNFVSRAAIGFDLSEIPVKSEVKSAHLYLFPFTSSNFGFDSKPTFGNENEGILYPANFTEIENMTFEGTKRDSKMPKSILPKSSFEAQEYKVDISKLMTNGSKTLNLVLALNDETRPFNALIFHAPTTTNSSFAPKLRVCYLEEASQPKVAAESTLVKPKEDTLITKSLLSAQEVSESSIATQQTKKSVDKIITENIEKKEEVSQTPKPFEQKVLADATVAKDLQQNNMSYQSLVSKTIDEVKSYKDLLSLIQDKKGFITTSSQLEVRSNECVLVKKFVIDDYNNINGIAINFEDAYLAQKLIINDVTYNENKDFQYENLKFGRELFRPNINVIKIVTPKENENECDWVQSKLYKY
ncbi:MAG: hypothetical protein MUE53_05810 [Chitinophagales bacterium]|jgi:hypothetical protein|nr:hypothetical protein [Chitinophagales bacterium]